jgi:hypothetical protein
MFLVVELQDLHEIAKAYLGSLSVVGSEAALIFNFTIHFSLSLGGLQKVALKYTSVTIMLQIFLFFSFN